MAWCSENEASSSILVLLLFVVVVVVCLFVCCCCCLHRLNNRVDLNFSTLRYHTEGKLDNHRYSINLNESRLSPTAYFKYLFCRTAFEEEGYDFVLQFVQFQFLKSRQNILSVHDTGTVLSPPHQAFHDLLFRAVRVVQLCLFNDISCVQRLNALFPSRKNNDVVEPVVSKSVTEP